MHPGSRYAVTPLLPSKSCLSLGRTFILNPFLSSTFFHLPYFSITSLTDSPLRIICQDTAAHAIQQTSFTLSMRTFMTIINSNDLDTSWRFQSHSCASALISSGVQCILPEARPVLEMPKRYFRAYLLMQHSNNHEVKSWLKCYSWTVFLMPMFLSLISTKWVPAKFSSLQSN